MGDKGFKETDSVRISALQPLAQGDITSYALMAALTRFIPLFLVDDAAETAIMNLMVNKIAAAHKLPVSGKDAGILATATWDVSKTTVSSTLYSVASRLLEKATVLLTAKYTVDAFSKNYHIGYLLDYACQESWVNKYPPVKLRKAIDQTCDHTDMSPFHRAAMTIFDNLGGLLGELEAFLRSQIIGGKVQGPAIGASSDKLPAGTKSVAKKLQAALDLMPPEYFINLRHRLQKELLVLEPSETSIT